MVSKKQQRHQYEDNQPDESEVNSAEEEGNNYNNLHQ